MARKTKKDSGKYLSQPILPGNLNLDFLNHSYTKKDIDTMTLRLKENFINYGANFFIFNDEKLEQRKINLFAKLCETGTVAIQYVNGDYLIYDLASFKQNLFTDIIEGQGILVVQGDSKSVTLTHRKNAVLVKGSRNMLPGFDYTQSFLNNITHALRNLYITRENSTKTKFIQKEKISVQGNEEVKQVNNSGESIVVVEGPIEQVHDLALKNETNIVWQDIGNSLQFYMYQEGMRFNSLEKGAEVKEVEAKNDVVGFEMLEDLRCQVVDLMVQDLNETYKLNITYETIVERNERKEKEKQEVLNDEVKTKNEPAV